MARTQRGSSMLVIGGGAAIVLRLRDAVVVRLVRAHRRIPADGDPHRAQGPAGGSFRLGAADAASGSPFSRARVDGLGVDELVRAPGSMTTPGCWPRTSTNSSPTAWLNRPTVSRVQWR